MLDVGAVVTLVALGVGLPALLALWAHSLGTPIGDDWSFRKVLVGFASTGNYHLVGWGSMTLVGQVLWGAIFVALLGQRPWVPSLAVATLAAAGLAGAYLLARRQLPPRRAVACCLLVVALPGFALSAWSFMTDVPTFAGEMGCLLLGACALHSSGRARLALLAVSIAVGLWAFSVREFAIAAPFAVLAVAGVASLATADRRLLVVSAGAGAALLAACLALYLWTSSLAGAQPKQLALPGAAAWERLAGAYFTLSFMVCPLLAGAIARRRLWRKPAAYVGAAAAVGLGAFLLAGHHALFIGNYLGERGIGGASVGAGVRPVLFSPSLWELFRALALVGGAALGGILAGGVGDLMGLIRCLIRYRYLKGWARAGTLGSARWSRATVDQMLVEVFTWASVAVLVFYALFFQAPFWDRYLWPVAFGVAVALERTRPLERATTPPRSRRAGLSVAGVTAGALGALLGVVTGALTLNADAFGAARWAAGKELVAAGYPAQEVDAGFEWVGAHAREPADPGRPRRAPAYETWYDRMFPGADFCAVVASSPLLSASLHLVRIMTYRELAFAVLEPLYLYEEVGPRCGDIRRLAQRGSTFPSQ